MFQISKQKPNVYLQSVLQTLGISLYNCNQISREKQFVCGDQPATGNRQSYYALLN